MQDEWLYSILLLEGRYIHSSSRYTALLHYYGVSQSNNETKFPREAIESPKVVLGSVWIRTRSKLSKKAPKCIVFSCLFIMQKVRITRVFLFPFIKKERKGHCKGSHIIIIRPKP